MLRKSLILESGGFFPQNIGGSEANMRGDAQKNRGGHLAVGTHRQRGSAYGNIRVIIEN